MYISKCQGVYNQTAFNLLYDLIYFLLNKVFKTWKNVKTKAYVWDLTPLPARNIFKGNEGRVYI